MAKRKKPGEDGPNENSENINESDDTFGLPEIEYEPLKREEETASSQTEDSSQEETSQPIEEQPVEYTFAPERAVMPERIGLRKVL